MLYLSLFLSVVLLAIANAIVRGTGRSAALLTLFCMGMFGSALTPFYFAPTALIQSLFLLIAGVLWRRTGQKPSTFLSWSLAATVAAYAVAGILVALSEREYSRLRREYPYESIEERLPLIKAVASPPPISATSSARINRLEDRMGGWGWYRAHQLRVLHEDTVGLFINSPGFGISRLGLPSTGGLALKAAPVPRQPGSRLESPWSPGDLSVLPQMLSSSVDWLLDESIGGFVHNRGFGFFKDRRHVAGFEAHRFDATPQIAEGLQLRRLDLVSLLLHREPVAYDSDELPRMDRVRETPTRALDRFETQAMGSLREGEDLVFSESPEVTRLLGAIRSLKQCIDCHGGHRGDLLGAFSYKFTPSPR